MYVYTYAHVDGTRYEIAPMVSACILLAHNTHAHRISATPTCGMHLTRPVGNLAKPYTFERDPSRNLASLGTMPYGGREGSPASGTDRVKLPARGAMTSAGFERHPRGLSTHMRVRTTAHAR